MTESAQADRGESGRPLVSAVMPCLNEELTLGICVDKALRAFRAMGVAGEVVVADNGSTDASVEVARAHGARVVHQLVKGYGAALQTGIDAAVGDFIIMGDADESYDWTAIAPFVEEWRKGADMVMGNRFRGGIKPDAMPALHRYLGNPVLSFISRLAFRVPLGDFHCGMRGFSKAAYEKMRPRTAGMEFATELIAGAARSGLKIVEIPVTLYPDKRNRPPHLRSFRDGWRHLRFIVTYAPHYLYLIPGASMLAIGLILQALLATGPLQVGRTYLGIHYLALGGLLMLIGFNVLTMGVIAKLIVADRYPLALGGKMMALLRVFSLERALTLGGTLLLAGLAIAGFIFRLWLQRAGGSMDDTVHPAFVAGHLMVLGFNVMFFSFIFHLAISERDADGSWRP
ncbi:MAG: glycosyltransferase family 2 protein [Betaproteobacteria bacterium]|nr:glycosyltransferase family 2 protein [Betaproteobacteria bacterium]